MQSMSGNYAALAVHGTHSKNKTSRNSYSLAELNGIRNNAPDTG